MLQLGTGEETAVELEAPAVTPAGVDAEGGAVSEDVVVLVVNGDVEDVEGGNCEDEKEEPSEDHTVSAGGSKVLPGGSEVSAGGSEEPSEDHKVGSGILKHVPPKEEGEPQDIAEESPSKTTSKGLACSDAVTSHSLATH